jgi:hypothetical protein
MTKITDFDKLILDEFKKSQGVDCFSHVLDYKTNPELINVISINVKEKKDRQYSVTQEILITEENMKNNEISLIWYHFGRPFNTQFPSKIKNPALDAEYVNELMNNELLNDVNFKLKLLGLPQLTYTYDKKRRAEYRFNMKFNWKFPEVYVSKMIQVSKILNDVYNEGGYKTQILNELEKISK